MVGIDGGGLNDLLGLAVLGREVGTRKWLLWNRALAHPSVLDQNKSEAGRIQDFARQGDLRMVDHMGEDIAEVADIIGQINESGKLAEKWAIGVDPIGAGQILEELSARGLAERIFGVSQGYKLGGAIATMGRKLVDGTLAHAGQPLMAWCVGNAKVEPRGNAILITKQASGTAKIDPLMASFNAVHLMQLNPDGKRSVYEDKELLILRA